jgi:mono/diheme cytochrome c family protein
MQSPRLFRLVCAMLIAPVAVPVTASAQVSGASPDSVARGRQIFVATCRGCHTISPPAQGGPPMSRIARHYVQRLGSRKAAAARIAEWLAGPTVEKSLLPRDEVARFGVMPHQPLADASRFTVAAYVVTLTDSGSRRGRGTPW